MPPDLIFVVSIADSNGDLMVSTHPSAQINIADQDYFSSQLKADAFAIGRPRKIPGSDEWQVQFSRRLDASDGHFAGIVMISVDAAYFVSGYEPATMGEDGMLGILGTDGVFRARRTGEHMSAGKQVDFAAVVTVGEDAESPATLTVNPWDGVLRYTAARQLYEFPLAVVVGSFGLTTRSNAPSATA